VTVSRHELCAWRLLLAGYLFGLFFGPEDGGSTFFRNVCKLVPDIMVFIGIVARTSDLKTAISSFNFINQRCFLCGRY
jgi:hypothetical protein